MIINMHIDTNHLSSNRRFLPSNHISYETESSIRKMIKPLEKMAGINYFCYGENYPDGSCFTLHSNSKYYESWFTGQGLLFGFYLENGWHSYDSLLPDNILGAAHSQDLGNFVIYVQRNVDKTIVFEFGTRPDNKEIGSFYQENSVLLKRFGNYFVKTLAPDLIPIANQQRIRLPSWMTDEVRSSINTELFQTTIEMDNPFKGLSYDDKLYVQYLLTGSLNTEIAKHLNLSDKTISKKIMKVKEKLGCKNNKELFEKACLQGVVKYDLHHPMCKSEEDYLHILLKEMYSPISNLSAQERNCYELVLKGYTLAETSKKLGIGIPTVADYVHRLKHKLKCLTKNELFYQAIENGFFQIDLC